MSRLMGEKGIRVHCNTEICGVGDDGHLIAADGRSFSADEVVWCTEVSFDCDGVGGELIALDRSWRPRGCACLGWPVTRAAA